MLCKLHTFRITDGMMNLNLTKATTYIAIAGQIAVSLFSDIITASLLWSVSNSYLIYLHYTKKEYDQLRMFCVFQFFCVAGLVRLLIM